MKICYRDPEYFIFEIHNSNANPLTIIEVLNTFHKKFFSHRQDDFYYEAAQLWIYLHKLDKDLCIDFIKNTKIRSRLSDIDKDTSKVYLLRYHYDDYSKFDLLSRENFFKLLKEEYGYKLV
jgi:hypothetical protein